MSVPCGAEHPDEFTCELPVHDEKTTHYGYDELRRRGRFWSGKQLDKNRTTWRSS